MAGPKPSPKPVYICECGNHAWTNLSKGYVTLVSPEDAHLLLLRAYSAKVTKKTVYAFYTDNKPARKAVYLARLILETDDWGDHRNGNGLDNRRTNLREATQKTNTYNRAKRSNAFMSNYKGVTRYKHKWQATCQANGVKRWGIFDTELEAAAMYQQWSKELHGEYSSVRV